MDKRVAVNRRHWNDRVPAHVASEFYDVAGFLDGRTTVAPFELEEVGDVRAKRLCHLQCHFGLDSLTWARHGADVVGLDFSRPAIDQARRLAKQTGLDDRASFVTADVYDAREVIEGDFNVVYVSFGAITWLPDLERWAAVIASLLRRRGFLYLAEFHPVPIAELWDEPYGGGVALYDEVATTYADPEAQVDVAANWQFTHSLGDVVSAVAGAGLRIEWLHERPVSPFWNMNDERMVRDEQGLWHQPGSSLPLSFSLKATKP
jgi:SAM-dependent methyltransferase